MKFLKTFGGGSSSASTRGGTGTGGGRGGNQARGNRGGFFSRALRAAAGGIRAGVRGFRRGFGSVGAR